ncbi:MAG: transposase [bacterium]
MSKLLMQDVRQRPGEKAEIIDGVAPDRIVSVHDPEMRHDHKSVSNRVDGYKASIAVDTESQLITDVDVLAANVRDSTNASALVAESAKNIERPINLVIDDGAYGTVEARLEAQEQGYTLIAPVGQIAPTGRYTKEEFRIDLQDDCVTCPAGQRTKRWYVKPMRTKRGTLFHHRQFSFSVKRCRSCPLRTQCLPPSMQHRTIFFNEHEDLLQQARFYQRTDEYRELYRKRVVVEHRIARLRRLGFRKARYFG